MRRRVAYGQGGLSAWFLYFLMAGCAPLISDYSLDAYKNATTLKAQTARAAY